MSKTKTETPVQRNSADIPWEETRLYLPADETEEENKALYERPVSYTHLTLPTIA